MNMHSRPDLFPPTTSAFQRYDLTPAQLDLVWDMNRGLGRREFDQFIETSRALGLNPFRRQICAFVLNEQNAKKRQFVIVTTIGGLRAIADRTGMYRPDSKPARMTFSEGAKNPRSNPHGIVDCIVTPYRFSKGRWHRIVGQVWWDEIAPIRHRDDGETYLDSRTPWPVRPRGQIIKCAEAAALRAGWPDALANVYSEDELDRVRLSDLTPSEAVDEAKKASLLERTQPRGTILIDMRDGNGLSAIPLDRFHDRVSEFIRSYNGTRLNELLEWRNQQRIAFRQFFVHDKNAGLDLKRQFEAIEANASAKPAELANGR
ncbi:phage recombination protein Bet [Mesorhizobium sp.]|uniref:phage recombination protein Bet n=1 Tax=Mesorhizobium sp. TaxID=1871066 RepID=UPI00257CBF91|nr:phage recombination protein Bet [Mesorhizobium sp.]